LEFTLKSELDMGALIYTARAFVLLFCCFSPSHRAKTFARWKNAPTYQIVLEVGGGIVGLLVLGELAYLIFSALTAPSSAPIPN